MTSIPELAATLAAERRKAKIAHQALQKLTGLSALGLRRVLSGEHDFKVSTLLSVADRLGLEVVLVPKKAAQALQAEQAPAMQTGVDAALERLK
ncbi:MAG TPA: XRE family transcriptional regulator [Bordetella sp.]